MLKRFNALMYLALPLTGLAIGLQPWHQKLYLYFALCNWGWLTGHLVHANLWHLAENLIGLWLFCVLWGNLWSVRSWCCCWLVAMLVIDLGLYWRAQLDWYYGLSGCLHGLAVAAALGVSLRDKYYGFGLLMLVGAKIGLEYLWGSPSQLLVGPVATDAHWLGALAGLVMLVHPVFRQRWRKQRCQGSA